MTVMQKVAFVFCPGPFGGAERVVVAGLKALADAGADARLILLREARAPQHADKISTMLAGVVPIEVIEIKGRFDPTPIRAIRKLLHSNPVDVVHTHGYKASFYVSLLGKSHRGRFVATHHGATSETFIVRLYERLERFALRRADRVIAVSPAMRDMLLAHGCGDEKLHVVENMLGLDVTTTKRSVEAKYSAVRFLFLGRISHEKGLDILVEAARTNAALRDPARFQFTIAGDGVERQSLEHAAPDNFKFVGFVDDPAPYLADAHAMVVPSRTEGMPMSVIEAVASGLPIIASDVGGLPQLVEANETGLLVTPDAPDALANALLSFVSNADHFFATAASTATVIQARFSPQKWAENTLKIYQTN